MKVRLAIASAVLIATFGCGGGDSAVEVPPADPGDTSDVPLTGDAPTPEGPKPGLFDGK